MKFRVFFAGVVILSTVLFGAGVCSEQSVLAESVVEWGGETTNVSGNAEEHTIRIYIDNKLVDTLSIKHGDTLTLTNDYKGMQVREWNYYDVYTDSLGLYYNRLTAIDKTATITITKDDDIIGYSQIAQIPEDAFDSDDKEKDNKKMSDNTSKKKLASPTILKCKRGMKRLTIKGKKGTIVIVKVGKKSKTIYMKNKMKKVLVLDRALKKGLRIKIFAKQSGYKKSKTHVYKVK